MKKLLTLVLALVLVFAIAAPALAITGDLGEPSASETEVAIAPVGLDVELFAAAPSYQYSAVLSYSKIAANKAYIVNEVVFWGVALTFVAPEAGETKMAMAHSDYDGATLTLSTDAFDLTEATGVYVYDAANKKFVVDNTEKLTKVPDKNKLTYLVNHVLFEQDNDLYFFGQGVVEAKGVLKAELKDTNTVDAGLLIYDGTKPLFRITHEATPGFAYDVQVLKAAAGDPGYTTTYWVGFKTNADNEVVGIYAAKDGETYRQIGYNVPGIPTSVVIPKALGGVDITDDTTGKDAAVWAAYEKVMAFFGFNYNAEGVLKDKHFEAKASGLYLKDEAVINLYTADIVVPGGVTPPKTGDAASIVGFVMIAVAMIAAGVVVSRKVRA